MNEIRDMENPKVIAVAKMLGNHIRSMEPTRPVTAAVNNLRPQKDTFFSTLDICGYNYAAGGDHDHSGEHICTRLTKTCSQSCNVRPQNRMHPVAFGAWMG